MVGHRVRSDPVRQAGRVEGAHAALERGASGAGSGVMGFGSGGGRGWLLMVRFDEDLGVGSVGGTCGWVVGVVVREDRGEGRRWRWRCNGGVVVVVVVGGHGLR